MPAMDAIELKLSLTSSVQAMRCTLIGEKWEPSVHGTWLLQAVWRGLEGCCLEGSVHQIEGGRSFRAHWVIREQPSRFPLHNSK